MEVFGWYLSFLITKVHFFFFEIILLTLLTINYCFPKGLPSNDEIVVVEDDDQDVQVLPDIPDTPQMTVPKTECEAPNK